jgi:hypothetical protein
MAARSELRLVDVGVRTERATRDTPLDLESFRIMRGIPLSDISEQTKISAYYLRAIEAEEFHRLPGGVFAANYLRQYAEIVGFDVARLLSRYVETTGLLNPCLDLPIEEEGTRGTALLRSILTSLGFAPQGKRPGPASERAANQAVSERAPMAHIDTVLEVSAVVPMPTAIPAPVPSEPALRPRPTSAEIATLAHELWLERGCPLGSPELDWLEAERRLTE